MEKFSIITVTYNAKDSIRSTVESVMKQTYRNWEYVFVDGGSNDGTVEVINSLIEEIESKGNHTKLISERDNGIYDAMNKGTVMSGGTWVSFLNAGDIYQNNNVLLDINEHIQKCNAGVIYGRSITASGIEFTTRKPWLLPYKKPFYHQAAFIRRDIQLKYSFNLKYNICADFDMFQRAYLDGVGFERVDVLVSKSSAEGISKNPRNREAVIEQDLSIMKANRIMWYKYPLEPYFRYQRMRELSEIKRKNT